MSLVLGPIHYWMYGKIQTTEGRESAIVSAFKVKYGAEADKILEQIYKKYPKSNTNKSLEELLANKPIHQGIQSLIVEVETREAATVAAFCAKHPDAAKIAAEAAHKHGISCGKEAVRNKGLSASDCENTSKAFEVMGDFLCDGMPCDRGAQVVTESDERTRWDHESCVHEPYWRNAGADFLTMSNIINEWIAGFGEGINPKIKYKREKAIAAGDSSCLSSFEINN
ncbi:MAG: L-2-amino-thiazoline-4-carboxylic acid hydrolase [Candidatus Brocadia sp.]|nr:L-2-amino-thiazoline-4-carboxylic acid hydrolase [Candidatus Brocadia sp.]